MKSLILSVCLALVPLLARAGSGADAKVRREWNFTPKDFAKLQDRGGSLQFSARSEWMPSSLRASILDVLNYTLNPKLTPSSTNGINRLDFFHGHFVCNGSDARISELGRQFDDKTTALFKTAGFNQLDNPTPKNFATFAKAVDETDRLATELLAQIMPLCENTTVMFHSFEYVTEKIGMSVEDARRHIYAPLGGGAVTRVQDAPAKSLDEMIKDLGSREMNALTVYSYMFHFGFLIDRQGFVHLTNGSGYRLHRFTGSRY